MVQISLAIERMCFLAAVSRAGFYRYLRAEDPWQEEMEVRSEVQRIVLEHPGRYGYRRITAELGRQGMSVNHKRVARLLREDNLVGSELWRYDGKWPSSADSTTVFPQAMLVDYIRV